MSDCCSTQPAPPPRRHHCPANGRSYPAVPYPTVLQQLRRPWQAPPPEQAYYFCDDPDCAVVYFGADDSVYTREALRTTVGQKSTAPDAPLCYCFDVSRADARDDPAIRAFVVEQTRQGRCACETRNPSGRCCLKDFPRAGEEPDGAQP